MATSNDDGSRIEAAEAGVHAEERELDEEGAAHRHVDAVDAVPEPAVGPTDVRDVVPHAVVETSDTGVAVADHGVAHVHDADAHAAQVGHGEADDPNAGVVIGIPPTPAWVMTAAGIGLVTVVVTVILAIMLHNADADRGSGGTPTHGHAAVTLTVSGS